MCMCVFCVKFQFNKFPVCLFLLKWVSNLCHFSVGPRLRQPVEGSLCILDSLCGLPYWVPNLWPAF